jgi:two-component system response regulator FixJ
MSNENIVVHILDDEIQVRKSLAFLISSAGYAVRVHATAEAFLEGCPYPPGHCLVTDLRMPGLNGVDVLKRLTLAGQHMPSIVISGHGDVPMAVSAMKEGAVDFIEKPFLDETLFEAIQRAASKLEDDMSRDREAAAVKHRLAALSEREREVFYGVVAGKANKTIAHEKHLSPRTVEVYRANVMAKMRAKTLPELVRMALAAGVTLDDV